MGLFSNKKDKNKKSLKPYRSFDVKPFEQIKDDLAYASRELIFSSKGMRITARRINKTLSIVMLIEDIAEFEAMDLSVTNLRTLKAQYQNGFDDSSWDLEKKVFVYVFKKLDKQTLALERKYSFSDKKTHSQGLIYNEEKMTLDQYTQILDHATISPDFYVTLFFDLAAKDPWEE